jgi:hypothetical protein
MPKLTVVFACVVLMAALVTGCNGSSGGSGSSGTSGSETPDGATLVNEKCQQCHSLDRVTSARKDAAGWETTVSRMMGNGLKLTDAEKAAVIDYLAKTYAQ